jgi:hypothetical protein
VRGGAGSVIAAVSSVGWIERIGSPAGKRLTCYPML